MWSYLHFRMLACLSNLQFSSGPRAGLQAASTSSLKWDKLEISAGDHELWVAKRSSKLVPSSPSQTQKLGIKNAYTDLIQTLYKLYTNLIYADGPPQLWYLIPSRVM